jgi:hypothetical protein
MSRYPPSPQPPYEGDNTYRAPYAQHPNYPPYQDSPQPGYQPQRPSNIHFGPASPYQQAAPTASSYSLADDEKEGYGALPNEEDDEVRPLANYPAGYANASSSAARFGEQGLSRRETNAEVRTVPSYLYRYQVFDRHGASGSRPSSVARRPNASSSALRATLSPNLRSRQPSAMPTALPCRP